METKMSDPGWLLDWALMIALVALAWQVSTTTDLFKAIVFFIGFGMLLALIWVRLEAVDIALAEAAIGAGLTGVLFLTTLSHLEDSKKNSGNLSDHTPPQEHPDDENS